MISDAVYTLLFYVFAIVTIAFALAVTMSRRLLRAAVYLMMVLLFSACMYIMLGAEFLAGVQVLVYVGGIVVLIVFAIMLTRSAELQLDRPPLTRKFLAALASLTFGILSAWIFWNSDFQLFKGEVLPQDNTAQIGFKLLDYGGTGYILPFEIISVLLLAAIIGSVVIARKTPPPQQPFTTGDEVKIDYNLPHTQKPQEAARRQE